MKCSAPERLCPNASPRIVRYRKGFETPPPFWCVRDSDTLMWRMVYMVAPSMKILYLAINVLVELCLGHFYGWIEHYTIMTLDIDNLCSNEVRTEPCLCFFYLKFFHFIDCYYALIHHATPYRQIGLLSKLFNFDLSSDFQSNPSMQRKKKKNFSYIIPYLSPLFKLKGKKDKIKKEIY